MNSSTSLFGWGDNIPYIGLGAPNDRKEGETWCGVGIVGDLAQHGP